MKGLTENAHPSHDFHADDDVLACDACGVRSYNDEAKRPCEQHEHKSGFVTVENGLQLWMSCVVCHDERGGTK